MVPQVRLLSDPIGNNWSGSSGHHFVECLNVRSDCRCGVHPRTVWEKSRRWPRKRELPVLEHQDGNSAHPSSDHFSVKEVTMANKSLFAGLKSLFPRARARNEAGGPAYALPPKHALAQIA